LIDADLRRPELHSFLGVPAEPGLGELLAYEATLPFDRLFGTFRPALFEEADTNHTDSHEGI